MIIYCVRHGKTNMNELGVYNGLIDEDINDIGIMLAEELKNDMFNIDYDVVYCSPMIRAKHTCDIINVKNIKPIYDDRLKERTLGMLDGKDFIKEGLDFEDFLNYNYKSDDPTFEDLPTLFKRVHNFLDELIEKDKDKKVLIVAHGGILRAIFFYFNKIPNDGKLRKVYPIPPNCKLVKYQI